MDHLVRIGTLGQIGRFHAADAAVYPRMCRVVLRTPRGLETGHVLTTTGGPSASVDGDAVAEPDGQILRRMTAEDEMLSARLERDKFRALDICSRRLAELGVNATLLDVEPLFDGSRVYFYFLGSVPDQFEQLSDELVELYEANVQFRQFSETLEQGCGPNCGTEEAEGKCVTCVSCAVASACSTGSRTP
ncbi:MAG: hypothetical protein DWQ31_21235 [Planctomycetota bacterium]|nr:MAG: hypothetical protein DWQ31_21235 [Planctomycetota bacterium]REJ93630.1 MAG: hypothetical protein DWQ35_09770 [Planctomycetota bacterium]REK25679.1 MAG: hypothetical protein DWQ42_10510 [Planctomycetota bacterium]REK46575.1 MAG: hypothetical protein DWQ46_06795 [Planctomycetota bacterium]